MVVQGNKEAVATYIAYPLHVFTDGKKTEIQTKEQFVKDYDQIMTEEVKKALLEQKVENTFVNYQGVMVGNGEIWFTVSPTDKHIFYISTINH